MDIKKRISLILCVMMLALAIFPVAIVSAAESQVSMTAKMGTTTLTDGGTYNVQGGEKVTVSAKSTVTNIERIGYYFESTDHAVKTDIKDIYKSSIEIPIPATNPIQGKEIQSIFV